MQSKQSAHGKET